MSRNPGLKSHRTYNEIEESSRFRALGVQRGELLSGVGWLGRTWGKGEWISRVTVLFCPQQRKN